jgi:prepilin-type processing-associated H-X9-DG protein
MVATRSAILVSSMLRLATPARHGDNLRRPRWPPEDTRDARKGCAVTDRLRHVNHGHGRDGSRRTTSAFTIIEVLFCAGLITIILSILLPTIGGLRRKARLVACASNIRQICHALQSYAFVNEGKFPPNVSAPAPGEFWCDRKRLGGLLEHRTPPNISSLGGGALACPEDTGGQRSYAMNIWASSNVDGYVWTALPRRGVLWSTTSRNTSQLILVAEAWSAYGTGDWFTAKETIGFAGASPGKRFGGAGGIAPPLSAGRFGLVNSELPFARHRVPGNGGTDNEARGRVQIGYADGHVELHADADLVQPNGTSSLLSLWTPVDAELNH